MLALLEGEDENASAANSEHAVDPATPAPLPLTDVPNIPSLVEEEDNDGKVVQKQGQVKQPKSPPAPLHWSLHICKPLCIICELQYGLGTTSTHTASPLSIPESKRCAPRVKEEVEEVEEAERMWAIVNGETTLLEDFENLMNVFMVETANSEVLKPQMLTEA